jgi:predicted O-methyltransferase YrrM
MDTLEYITKKYNLDPNVKPPIHLSDIGRNDLALLFAELGFTKGAEIGVLFGRYSKILCETNPKLRLYSIDPWLAYKEYRNLHTQKINNDLYERTKKNLAPFNCEIIRKMSMDAVKDFPDNSLDFVYIDGNHEFTSEANDIHEWSKKVKPGGIISGHDYRQYIKRCFSHSYEVVNAYTSAYGINPWFIIGRNKDKIRSWFWIRT